DDIQFQLYPAGHIEGACSVEIVCYRKTIVFSGDIGRDHSELLPSPTHPATADFVVMESTYGDRLHESYNIGDHLAYIINETIRHGGNILIPCFAVGRAQEVMHMLYKLKQQKCIPSSIPVFLDSPMAASANKALMKYPDWITISQDECARMFSGVTINHDYQGTEKIIKQKQSKIVLAASGMLTGGRVLEYLKHYVTDSRNTIIIIGYQAEGTRGRALLNGANEIKIHGQYYPLKANIEEIGGLSAHADQAGLITWLKGYTSPPERVFLVHGEPGAQETLRVKIKDELAIKAVVMKQEKREYLFSINVVENVNL
ncbi:MAG TPA: MBL fold metallo-hydrolase, partial [Mucilaginibacter sp.]|nr:MBL fold metallo-hydrolase [Mucilaginibacter sp.]